MDLAKARDVALLTMVMVVVLFIIWVILAAKDCRPKKSKKSRDGFCGLIADSPGGCAEPWYVGNGWEFNPASFL